MSDTLFYIHDPMCSWCYAFQPALFALKNHLPCSVRLEKRVGGLAPDTTTVMPPHTSCSVDKFGNLIIAIER